MPNGQKALIDLTEGDTDPICGNKIVTLVMKDNTFIVYLTGDHDINWATHKYINFPPDFGLVTNRVRALESISKNLYRGKKLCDANYVIAEGLARVLDDHNTTNAQLMLNDAEKMLTTNGRQILKIEYLRASFYATISVGLILSLSWIFRTPFVKLVGSQTFDVILALLCGGIGSFISSFIRSVNFNGDVHIQKSIYRLDGVLRIFYGLIAGFIIALAVKSNILFGIINEANSNSTALLYLFGTMAGASETLVPSIIQKIEGSIGEK